MFACCGRPPQRHHWGQMEGRREFFTAQTTVAQAAALIRDETSVNSD